MKNIIRMKQLAGIITESQAKKINEELKSSNKELWNSLKQDDFEGKLENWKSIIVIAYDSIFQDNFFRLLDYMKSDIETLESKYSRIKYKINLGNRSGESPFIEISNS